jgi:tRNA-dihydrouridine synthase B
MISETTCDAIMVGRASLGNPWIFAEIKAALNGEGYNPPSAQERKAVIIDHIRTFRQTHGERFAAGEMKKWASWYIKGMAGANTARCKIFTTTSSIEIERIIDGFWGS